MKKLILALPLLLSVFAISFADDGCGMKNGAVDPDSYELCGENININIHKHFRNRDVATSISLSGNDAQTVSVEDDKAGKYELQQSIMNDAKKPITNLIYKTTIVLLAYSLIMFMFYKWWGISVKISALIGSILIVMLMQLPSYNNRNQKLLETLASEFDFIGEK